MYSTCKGKSIDSYHNFVIIQYWCDNIIAKYVFKRDVYYKRKMANFCNFARLFLITSYLMFTLKL